MKIDNRKLDLILARQCRTITDLRVSVSPQTLTRVRRCEDVKPATIGRIAKALDVDVTEILKEE